MARARLLVGIMILLATVPLAAAGVDQCSQPGLAVSKLLPPSIGVVGSKVWQDGSCGGTGVVGGGTGTCASPVGQICFGFYPPGAFVVCEWQVGVGSTVVALAAGIDANMDGNVWAGVDPVLALDKPLLPPLLAPSQFGFFTGAGGELMAYPVSALTGGSASDITLVRCV